MARMGERPAARAEQQRIANADRPDEAFTTDRAVSCSVSQGRVLCALLRVFPMRLCRPCSNCIFNAEVHAHKHSFNVVRNHQEQKGCS
jgi:hypothetical protein